MRTQNGACADLYRGISSPTFAFTYKTTDSNFMFGEDRHNHDGVDLKFSMTRGRGQEPAKLGPGLNYVRAMYTDVFHCTETETGES